MNTLKHSQLARSAFTGFALLFSAIMVIYCYLAVGREKEGRRLSALLAVIVAGSLAMYWNELSTFAMLALVSVILTAGAYGPNQDLTQGLSRVARGTELRNRPVHR